MIKLSNTAVIFLGSCQFTNRDFLNDFWKQVVPRIVESSQTQVAYIISWQKLSFSPLTCWCEVVSNYII